MVSGHSCTSCGQANMWTSNELWAERTAICRNPNLTKTQLRDSQRRQNTRRTPAWTAGSETRNTECRTKKENVGAANARRKTTRKRSRVGLSKKGRSAKTGHTFSSGLEIWIHPDVHTGLSRNVPTSRMGSHAPGFMSEKEKRTRQPCSFHFSICLSCLLYIPCGFCINVVHVG